MHDGSLMTTLSASLRLRPTRIGFLVDPDDAELLQRVFQVCTCLWGGTFNPVIPVCRAVPVSWQDNPFPTPSPADLARGYVNFFEPDVFVETKEGLAASIGLAQSKLDFQKPRIVPLDFFSRPMSTVGRVCRLEPAFSRSTRTCMNASSSLSDDTSTGLPSSNQTRHQRYSSTRRLADSHRLGVWPPYRRPTRRLRSRQTRRER